ncbi:BQ5605_C004g02971 [Microbotryum silenes-dioicae]|uniref:Vesicular-fusion protein SEC18 n=1 Tax=Microbotryum silenes-dioicae TaxID=796604 RepID=A0A2X0P4U9_9BASI|nr:BQ5605_C004g02971 [Microbotryum silenes-dioicae]
MTTLLTRLDLPRLAPRLPPRSLRLFPRVRASLSLLTSHPPPHRSSPAIITHPTPSRSWFSGSANSQPPPPPTGSGRQPAPVPAPYYTAPPPQPARTSPASYQRVPAAADQQRRPGPQYDSGSGPAPPSARNTYQQQQTPSRGGAQIHGQQGQAHGTPGQYNVVPIPPGLEDLAHTNKIVVSERDWQGVNYVNVRQHMRPSSTPYSILPHPRIQSGTIAAGLLIRTHLGFSKLGDTAVLSTLDSLGPDTYLASLDLEVAYLQRNAEPDEPYDTDQLQQIFLSAYDGLMVSIGQPMAFEFRGRNLKVTVKGLHHLSLGTKEGSARQSGIITSETEVNFIKDPASAIKIKSSAKKAPPNAILAPNFKFEDMGIGGLDTEFSAIFRRAFASRIFPPGLVEKLGIQHVKGILLYGPPGTGKTLMARQIGKMLNAREPKVVNGPEILNKFVGQSEENIRKLFADAEKEYKEKGDESGLHIIIFDELDAICKQRGSTNNGTGVGDSVVNQLLSKMDGVDQLNNILIIGMTNRIDMIDEALTRPGRLEVHIEISLPDENGRVQILTIHTAKMRTNGVMGKDVDLHELATLTKNFSGAEIGGLVKSATSFAFNRHVKVGTLAGISDDIDQIQVGREDFMHALDEVQPAFGVNEEELQQVVQNGIIHFADHVSNILQDGKLFVEQVRSSTRTPLVSLLLHGPSGSGKTALAATIAMASGFPFIKLISAENMIGFNEGAKIQYLNKVFTDSYKSPLSVIVVDGIERILEYVPIGPRFSNGVLQALIVLLAKRPPKGRRLLIISTTSNRRMLQEMDALDAFASELRVPALSTLRQIDYILRDVQLFPSKEEGQRAMQLLVQAGFGEDTKVEGLSLGVKKLLGIAEMCRQEPEGRGDKLVQSLMELQY